MWYSLLYAHKSYYYSGIKLNASDIKLCAAEIMVQFLCGMDLYNDICVMYAKTDHYFYPNVQASLLFYYYFRISHSSFMLLSCVEESYKNFVRHLILVQKRSVCAPENNFILILENQLQLYIYYYVLIIVRINDIFQIFFYIYKVQLVHLDFVTYLSSAFLYFELIISLPNFRVGQLFSIIF